MYVDFSPVKENGKKVKHIHQRFDKRRQDVFLEIKHPLKQA